MKQSILPAGTKHAARAALHSALSPQVSAGNTATRGANRAHVRGAHELTMASLLMLPAKIKEDAEDESDGGVSGFAEAESDRLFVTALARGLALLRCFRRGERTLGNADFAARSGLPKATVSRLTYTLTRLGYLDAVPGVGKYALGAGVLALGYAYLSGLPVRDIARPLLEALATETQSTVVLGAREQLHMVCLDVAQGHPLFRLNLDVGTRVPHGLTALGRAQLCALPESERGEWLTRYRRITPPEQWPAMRAGIDQVIADYEHYGFCLSLGEWNADVYAVGVPLASREGGFPLALSISGPAFNMTRERLIKELGPQLLTLRDRLVGN
jgi:DNA-binding IclR family transcriptional regulator